MNDLKSEEAPSIRTDRLWLTSFSLEDAPAVLAYASNPAVSRYTTWTPHSSIEDAKGFIRYALGERYCWAIRLSADGAVVGAIECTEEDPEMRSIHYVLSEEYWGRGIMTEAVEAVLAWAFDSHPHLKRITTTVIEEHGASRRVLEKCGMEFTGHVSEKWTKFDEPVRLAAYAVARQRGVDTAANNWASGYAPRRGRGAPSQPAPGDEALSSERESLSCMLSVRTWRWGRFGSP